MTTTTSAAGVWPARACYLATALFTGASGGTNLIYGWNKGTDLPSSLVWAAVSIGVSIVFALSWPALIRSMDQRQWARAVMVFAALLITGAYSVSAALGSASGGRANAATQEHAIADYRTKTQVAYETAKSELAGLAPTRPAGELRALIEGAKADPRSGGCVLLQGSMQMRCPKLTSWRVELARAERRQDLAAAMAKAQGDFAKAQTPIQANSDAVALASYLQAVGIAVPADTVNRFLALLAVLVVECGGGLALAVGLSLLHQNLETTRWTRLNTTEVVRCGPSARSPSGPDTMPAGLGGSVDPGREPPQHRRTNHAQWTRNQIARAILNRLQDCKVIDSSERAIARSVGATKSSVRRALYGLVAANLVTVETSSQGSIIRLVAA